MAKRHSEILPLVVYLLKQYGGIATAELIRQGLIKHFSLETSTIYINRVSRFLEKEGLVRVMPFSRFKILFDQVTKEKKQKKNSTPISSILRNVKDPKTNIIILINKETKELHQYLREAEKVLKETKELKDHLSKLM